MPWQKLNLVAKCDIMDWWSPCVFYVLASRPTAGIDSIGSDIRALWRKPAGDASARMGDSTRAEAPRRKGEKEEWR